jgi:hypothetical protein
MNLLNLAGDFLPIWLLFCYYPKESLSLANSNTIELHNRYIFYVEIFQSKMKTAKKQRVSEEKKGWRHHHHHHHDLLQSTNFFKLYFRKDDKTNGILLFTLVQR